MRGGIFMSGTVLIGRGHEIMEMPQKDWESGLFLVQQHIKGRLGFMSEEHHLARNLVVRELPNVGEPLSPEFIAQELNLPVSRVNVILEELEKHLTFLFRNEQGAVTWAYPVTVDNTPHHITFNTGEQIYAA
jgi:hypothetical protein